MFQTCAFHGSEDVEGMPTGMANGELSFTCDRKTEHPEPGPRTWLQVPAPPDIPGIGGLAAELRLDIELPAAIAAQHGRWVEYGVVEHAYAHSCPDDFAIIVERFGHRAITPARRRVGGRTTATSPGGRWPQLPIGRTRCHGLPRALPLITSQAAPNVEWAGWSAPRIARSCGPIAGAHRSPPRFRSSLADRTGSGTP